MYACSAASVDIQFTYVENYPDAAPLIELSSNEVLTDENVQELEELMLKEVNIEVISSC